MNRLVKWFAEKREQCIESEYSDGIYLTIVCAELLFNIIGIFFCQKVMAQLNYTMKVMIVAGTAIVTQIIIFFMNVVELFRLKRDWYLD